MAGRQFRTGLKQMLRIQSSPRINLVSAIVIVDGHPDENGDLSRQKKIAKVALIIFAMLMILQYRLNLKTILLTIR